VLKAAQRFECRKKSAEEQGKLDLLKRKRSNVQTWSQMLAISTAADERYKRLDDCRIEFSP
jgi:hypothetical protein